MKRDTSEEDKGGENLELLKAFKNDEEAIAALEGIEEHLTNFDVLFDKKLEDKSLTEEQRALLTEKRAQYEELKETLESGFEELFLDKAAFSSNGGADGKGNEDADDGVDSEEEGPDMTRADVDDATPHNAGQDGDPTKSGKGGKGSGGGLPMPLAGVKKKKKPAADEEDSEDAADGGDDEAAEGEADGEEAAPSKKKPTKKSDEDDAEDDEELDAEEQELLKNISAELERGEKLRKDLKEQSAQQSA
jgi:hypothetical protein